MTPAILIVHDDAVVARALQQTLMTHGHGSVAIAATEADGDTMPGGSVPDVLLVGIALRGEGDVSRATAEAWRRRAVPVVFVVDGADEATVAWARGMDGLSHVVQPFTERELRATLELARLRHAAAGAGVHELEERFFDVSIDLVCMLGFDGHFARLNPAWERTLGFTREELMAKPFLEFVHPDDRERTIAQNRAVRSGGQALSFENRYLCRDGSYRWLRWNAAPDHGSRLIYSVARDVTASRQAEEEREGLVHELQAALAELSTLRSILPMCAWCRRIRDDADTWHTVEGYIARHTTTRFSHGICPGCMDSEVEPQLR